jgi:hypothetical protein
MIGPQLPTSDFLSDYIISIRKTITKMMRRISSPLEIRLSTAHPGQKTTVVP